MNDWADRSNASATTDGDDRRRRGLVAFRISAIYLICGLLWIKLSDDALAYFVTFVGGDPLVILKRFETIKGFAFIFVSAFLLYILVRSFTRSIYATELRGRKSLMRVAEDYKLLFKKNPVAMWVYDPETLRIVAVNQRALDLYGYPREEFIGMRITDLPTTEGVAEVMQNVAAPIDPKFTGPRTHKRKDGSLFEADIISHSMNFDDKPARLVMVLDVTDRVRAERALDEYRNTLELRVHERTADLSAANHKLQDEIHEREKLTEQLRQAKQVAEQASTAKTVFLANTTHEIRTPLTSILGYADLLLDGGISDEHRDRYVHVLRQNASHLLKMIDDLLDLSRIETGNLKLTLDDYSPREIAEQTLQLLNPRAAEKGLVFSLDFEGDIPGVIRTDGVRLRQILLNLLSNAIKFTPSGRVSLFVRGDDHVDESAERWLQFDVVDTGIGIGEIHRDKIFEPFYQVEQGNNRRYGGTGLGLAISRKLVEQMGGALDVTSQLGHGSVFRVKIPLIVPVKVTQQSRPAAQESRINGHVLLAEDNANIRWLVEEYLRRAGASVTSVSDGLQALAAVRTRAHSSSPFDLILLDISMPSMDGPVAMRRIREEGYAGPIVALTAHSNAEEQSHFIANGWDAVAAKPINRHTFIPLIARLIGEKRQPVG